VDLNKQVKDFLDAGGSMADAVGFVNAKLLEIHTSINETLRDDANSTIQQMEQEIQLQQQRAQTIAQTNQQINNILNQGVQARGRSVAVQKAQQIRDAEDQEAITLHQQDQQENLLKAQIGDKAKLFGLTLDQQSLDAAALAIQEQITAEDDQQIQLLAEMQKLLPYTGTQGLIPGVPQFNALGQPLPTPPAQPTLTVNLPTPGAAVTPPTIPPGTPASAQGSLQAAYSYWLTARNTPDRNGNPTLPPGWTASQLDNWLTQTSAYISSAIGTPGAGAGTSPFTLTGQPGIAGPLPISGLPGTITLPGLTFPTPTPAGPLGTTSVILDTAAQTTFANLTTALNASVTAVEDLTAALKNIKLEQGITEGAAPPVPVIPPVEPLATPPVAPIGPPPPPLPTLTPAVGLTPATLPTGVLGTPFNALQLALGGANALAQGRTSESLLQQFNSVVQQFNTGQLDQTTALTNIKNIQQSAVTALSGTKIGKNLLIALSTQFQAAIDKLSMTVNDFSKTTSTASGASPTQTTTVPSAAGGYDVPRDTFAKIHKREVVLPENLANGFKAILESLRQPNLGAREVLSSSASYNNANRTIVLSGVNIEFSGTVANPGQVADIVEQGLVQAVNRMNAKMPSERVV
jgi:hypothetical protein